MPRSLEHILRDLLLKWYFKNHRRLPWRETSDPYAIWVSEVMLQQTRVATVIAYHERFMKRFPNLETLASAELDEVLKLWEGLGYYARARNLHKAARQCISRFDGVIPSDFHTFRQLPGVGDYIASAVLSIAFQKPHCVVDGNVKRVLARLFEISIPVNDSGSHKLFEPKAREFIDPKSDCHQGIFNQAIMELGALVCTPRNPSCTTCPVADHCRAYRGGTTSIFPKRKKKKPLPTYRISVGVVRKNGRVLITRRKPDGLLGGLWEFPGGKRKGEESAEDACVREIKEEVSLEVRVDRFITRVKHAYTHFKILMDVFDCSYLSGRVRLKGPVAYKWVFEEDLEKFAFPGANRKFIPLIRSPKL